MFTLLPSVYTWIQNFKIFNLPKVKSLVFSKEKNLMPYLIMKFLFLATMKKSKTQKENT